MSEKYNILSVYERIIFQCNHIYTWIYSDQGALVTTNCEKTPVYQHIFEDSGSLTLALKHAAKTCQPQTLCIGIGLMWGVLPELNRNRLVCLHVVGPLVNKNISSYDSDYMLHLWEPHFPSHADQQMLFHALQKLPLIGFHGLREHLKHIHYEVNQHVISEESIDEIGTIDHRPFTDNYQPGSFSSKKWKMKRALLEAVYQGDSSQSTLLVQFMNGGIAYQYLGTAFQQHCLSGIAFITECSDMAIEAGLLPDTAFAMRTSFIIQAQSCSNHNQLQEIVLNMYENFCHMVEKAKQNQNYSPQVRHCIDYIRLHITEALTIESIATHFGYSSYYFTRKFKKETGTPLMSYIKTKKIRKAKQLLKGGDMSIQQISDALSFSNRTFFTNAFHDETGMSPSEYRRS